MSGFTVMWIAWIALFLLIEGVALVNKKPDDTLSEHVWRWFSIANKGPWWRLRRFALAAFLAWLVLHFLSGGMF